jgi:murein DD-endopeptidase MepM/ murein hydrolase activator NlpD
VPTGITLDLFGSIGGADARAGAGAVPEAGADAGAEPDAVAPRGETAVLDLDPTPDSVVDRAPTSASPPPSRWATPSPRGSAPAAPRSVRRGPLASDDRLEPPRMPPWLGGGRTAPGVHLSPKMTAVFGGLFGLATLTSIVALLIQVVPPRDERAILAGASAAPSASAVTARAGLEARKPKRVAIPGPWRLSELEKDPSVIVASAGIDRKSFIDALADKGVPKAQAYRIMKAFEGLRKFDKTGKKDRFSVGMDRATRRVRAFEYQVSPTEIYQAREDQNGLLVGVRLDLKIADAEVVSAFYVGADKVESYQLVGLEDGILATLDEALDGRLSSDSFEEGATVRVIAIEQTALGLFAGYKGIVALEYRPRDPAGKPLRVYRFQGEQSRGYFDDRGRQPFGGGWRSPVPGAPVTSRFNPKRMHPVLKKVMPHQGTDFGAPTGTPVYSAYQGVVDWVGPHGASGNLVTITHPNGVQTGYAHLSRFAPSIKQGDKVGVHQLVGYVGSTGRSTGPHLHFSAKKDGKYFDAETLQLDGERVMPPSDRPAFLAAKADLDKRLDAIPLPEPPPEKPKPVAATEPAAAQSAAPAGIHPSGMIEDDTEEDEEGDQPITAPALGPTPSAPAAPKPPPDPAAAEDE